MIRTLCTPLFTKLARLGAGALVTVVFLLGVSRATASPVVPMLSLSSATNLNTLHVGDSFTVDVTLTGLTAATTLNLLSGTAQYSGVGLLSAPNSVTKGPILAGVTQSDITTLGGLNFAETDFQTFSSAPADQVSTNGKFFSFNLTAQALGSGTIFFSFTDALAGDPNGTPFDPGLVAGPAITFNIVPAGGGGGGGVPLPPALVPAALCLAAMAFARHRLLVR